MKTLALILALSLAGCAIPFDSRPPWQRMTPTHDPLMSVPHPNPHWP